MKILGGVIERDAGTIELNGEQIELNSPAEAGSRHIEFIHQELSVLDKTWMSLPIFSCTANPRAPVG